MRTTITIIIEGEGECREEEIFKIIKVIFIVIQPQILSVFIVIRLDIMCKTVGFEKVI